MKEIKFRCHIGGQGMRGPFTLQQLLRNEHMDFYNSKNWNLSDPLTNVMQYTGLKDKNGKEIYKGDILKNTNDFGVHYNIVTFKKGMFTISEDEPEMPLNMSCSYQEVVGNIYENSELLGEIK